MAMLFSFLLLLLPFFLTCFLFFLIGQPRSANGKLPAGSRGWPIIGETIAFARAGRQGHPENFINHRIMKFSSPEVFKTSLIGENVAVFCGASGNKFLFSGERKYVDAWWPPSFLKVLFVDNVEDISFREELPKIRQLLPDLLKPESLKHHIPIMDSMAKEHLDTYWLPNKQVKVFPLVKKFTFAVACRLFVNINDPNHVTKLLDPFNLVVGGLLSAPVNFPGTSYYRAIQGGKVVLGELLTIIRTRKMEMLEKKNMATRDLLTRMLLTSDENGKFMTEKEIATRLTGLLIGGYETLSITITFLLKFLAEHPHVHGKVFQEQMEIAKSKGPEESLNWDDIQQMKYSWCVVCEILRLFPPAQGAFRDAITDFTYAGFVIPKGWKAYWTPNSTHKNPEYFPEPEKFDPSRFEGSGPVPYSFVPFGGGPRMCPGKEYARLNILAFMHNMVKKFRWETIIPDEKIVYAPSPVPVNDLPVRLEPLQLPLRMP